MSESKEVMSNITIDQMPFTAEEWGQTPPAVQQFVLTLLITLQSVQAENVDLQERFNRHSGNSSRPPSSDGPEVERKPRSQTNNEGRNRGGQPGHKGTTRTLIPVEEVKEVKNHKPEACCHCGHALAGEDPDPRRHQVTEIPPIIAEVIEHRLHTLTCSECGGETTAEWPDGVPVGAFGPHLQAMVSLLGGKYHLSKREIGEIMSDFFQADLALGTVPALEQRTSKIIKEPVEEVRQYVRRQSVVHVDETGWKEANKRAWLWVAASVLATVYFIRPSRGSQVAKEMLGLDFTGIAVSDRWSAYNWLLNCLRQLCWAHLQRDFQAFIDRGGPSAELGQALLSQAELMFQWWHAVRDGSMSRATFQLNMIWVQQIVGELLRLGLTCNHPKTAGSCRDILKREAALWTFVWVPEVEPTNNLGERQVRPGVLWRNTSFGTQSKKGSRFVERIMTVVATLKQQNRNALEYLTAACEAANWGRPAPSLLPDNAVIRA
jgi:transposase